MRSNDENMEMEIEILLLKVIIIQEVRASVLFKVSGWIYSLWINEFALKGSFFSLSIHCSGTSLY